MRYSDRSSQTFRNNLFSDLEYEGRKILRNFFELSSDYRHDIRSRDSSVLIATGLDGRVSIPGKGDAALIHSVLSSLVPNGYRGHISRSIKLNLVQRLRIVELYHHTPTRIDGVVLNRQHYMVFRYLKIRHQALQPPSEVSPSEALILGGIEGTYPFEP